MYVVCLLPSERVIVEKLDELRPEGRFRVLA